MFRRRLAAILLALFIGTATMGADVDCDIDFNDDECDFFCDGD